MSNIEDLVRQSLQQRAEDVETTPALWQEVDRRIARRRQLQVAVWSLAGVAAVVAGVLVVPSLVTGMDPTPEIEPMDEAPTEAPDGAGTEEGSDAGTSEDAAPTPAEEPADPPTDWAPDGELELEPELPRDDLAFDDAALPEPLLVATHRDLELLGPGGRELVYTFHPEGESTIMGLAVRPGSTVDDITAVVLTTAEGMWDLRHFRIADGEVEVHEPFTGSQAPGIGAEPSRDFRITAPVFSPDGDAVAWIEGTTQDLRLRIVGWEDGPGTGERATDNTSFGLDLGDRAGFPVLHGWHWTPEASPEGSSAITVTLDEPTSDSLFVPLVQLPDGAWTHASEGHAGGIGTDAGMSGAGAIHAVEVTAQEGTPRWMVRMEDGGLVAIHEPLGDQVGEGTSRVDLPADLLAGARTGQLSIHSVGDLAVVTSLAPGAVEPGIAYTRAAYRVDPDGQVVRLSSAIGSAAPIR